MRGTPDRIAAELLGLRREGLAGLLLDYDGTFVGLTTTPDTARLDAAERELLLALPADPRLRLALITGRDLASLAAVTGELPGVAIAANGGLVIHEGGRVWTHPEALARAPEVEAIRAELTSPVAQWPGALIEAKTLSLTVHFRACPEAEPTLRAACRDVVAWHGNRFRLLETKHGVEVQPNLDWDKGRAAIELLDRWGVGAASLYAGDDVIDEPGFVAVRQRGGVTCRVGDERATEAEWTLSSPDDVRAILVQILRSNG